MTDHESRLTHCIPLHTASLIQQHSSHIHDNDSLMNSKAFRKIFHNYHVYMIQALVVRKADYCNSVLTGFLDTPLRLQSVLNAAARLVFTARRLEHAAPFLCELHWLRVPERIQFWPCLTALCRDYTSRGPSTSLYVDVSGLLQCQHWSCHQHLVTVPFRQWLHVPGMLCLCLFKRTSHCSRCVRT